MVLAQPSRRVLVEIVRPSWPVTAELATAKDPEREPQPTAMSDLSLVPGPIYGLRTWCVAGAPGKERLMGSQRTTTWPVGGALLEGECSATPPHAPPGATWACGLHAWHPRRATARRVCAVRSEVPGIFEASGAVELHADGFRAERGRPYALALLPGRNARQLERLAEAYDVELLRLHGPSELLAHCRERGLGLAESVVTELMGAERLAAHRRQRRRRGVLTAAAIAAAALILAGIAMAIDPGVERGKVLYGRSGEIHVR
jgi:hypothetical protein